LLVRVLVLGIKKVAVSTKLEDEVEDVEEKQYDGGSVRQSEDALVLVPEAALVKDGRQLYSTISQLVPCRAAKVETYDSGDDERGRRECHERAGSLCCSRRKDLLCTIAGWAAMDDTTKQEAHAHHQ
jgi:hypothetical protein